MKNVITEIACEKGKKHATDPASQTKKPAARSHAIKKTKRGSTFVYKKAQKVIKQKGKKVQKVTQKTKKVLKKAKAVQKPSQKLKKAKNSITAKKIQQKKKKPVAPKVANTQKPKT